MAEWEGAYRPLWEAIAFAARAHLGTTRRGGTTPYVAHVFRVCTHVQERFGVADRDVLITALLHDTLEKTTTTFDDLVHNFGRDVASWVAALSKDNRLSPRARETAYCSQLAQAPWQVQICKLADILDKLFEADEMAAAKRWQALEKSDHYLQALKTELKPEARRAWDEVKHFCEQIHRKHSRARRNSRD